MSDAQQSTAALLRRAEAEARGAEFETDGDGVRNAEDDEIRSLSGRDDLAHSVANLLGRGRSESAVGLFAAAEDRGITPRWETSDQVAVALLHLGRPAEAGRIWERASDFPSQAIQLTRLATAALAALDFVTAERTYQTALKLDPARSDAWFGLALLHTQRGDAPEALAAARQGLRQTLTPAQTLFLRGIETLTVRYEK
jgi:tetratricopeptide (TPR) repeat protein